MQAKLAIKKRLLTIVAKTQARETVQIEMARREQMVRKVMMKTMRKMKKKMPLVWGSTLTKLKKMLRKE